MKKLTDYLSINDIKIVESATHDEAINILLDIIKDSKNIENYDQLKSAIIERESIISTGIGVGLAIPHARKNSISDFVAAAVLIKNGCEWNAIDSQPVHFVILIASPQNTHKDYLRLLAQTVLLWKDTDKRKMIMSATSREEIISTLERVEADI